ncbi:hypothetical protein KP509_29G010000 [Ceratopteris richardii]|uniref:Uncharacterized protein n=1 Tax=Ceratopteris richardii TaxID=49495 RepID=A0A8T2R5R3_CERRI|nr:hypothetical protein KP509_29G010000 [Ceratopteris richardii]
MPAWDYRKPLRIALIWTSLSRNRVSASSSEAVKLFSVLSIQAAEMVVKHNLKNFLSYLFAPTAARTSFQRSSTIKYWRKPLCYKSSDLCLGLDSGGNVFRG